jgi:hypothetical protein
MAVSLPNTKLTVLIAAGVADIVLVLDSVLYNKSHDSDGLGLSLSLCSSNCLIFVGLSLFSRARHRILRLH